MRILYLANNRVAPAVARRVRESGDQIVALVMHPPERRKFGRELLEAVGLKPSAVFDASKLGDSSTLEQIMALGPEIGVSVLFGYILKRELLKLLSQGCINLHPALLPYNRGANPNVWSIVDRTPAGVTLHYVDEGIDTGDIVAQRVVPVDAIDTGESLYRKLEEAMIEVFCEAWPLIRVGAVAPRPQPRSEGTYHKSMDLKVLDEIDLDRHYSARELIDILRARTFPPYPGAFFWHKGRKVLVSLQLAYEEDHQQTSLKPLEISKAVP